MTKATSLDNSSDFRQGGCVLEMSELWTNYILTVNTAALEKPEQLAMFANGFIGGTYSGPIFLGCPGRQNQGYSSSGNYHFLGF
ncbi:MAG: hypothetical protein IPM96_17920 [Ignavibacteria bacterium]|nr:hypothetical protein [Ignavibacteria bacterium]